MNSTIERALGRKGARRLRGRLLGRTHLLPDFVIIGAARSGTTHLLGQLNAHPNVLEGPAETHFFDTPPLRLRPGLVPAALPGQPRTTRCLSTGVAPGAHR